MSPPAAQEAPLVVEAGLVLDGRDVHRDAAIRIEDGRIAALGRAAELEAVPAARRLGGRQLVAVPGLVNAHQHGRADSTLTLGVLDAPLECWLVALFAAVGEDPYTRTLRLCQTLHRAGITTALHMHSTYAPSLETYEAELRSVLDGYRDGGVRVVLAAALRDRGTPVYGDADAFLAGLPPALRDEVGRWLPPALDPEATLEVIDALAADAARGRYGDAAVGYGPAGPPWCSAPLLAAIARRADARRAPVHTHLLETVHERHFSATLDGGGAVAALDRAGLLSPRLSLAHAVWASAGDASLLAERGVSVVTNPSSNLRLHAGVAPLEMLLDAGVNVALGTDNMTLGGEDDVLADARLARALQRRPGATEQGLDPARVLEMATRNGGIALQRADVGVLRPGAAGDVVLLDVGVADERVAPAELVIGHGGLGSVETVVAAGRVVVDGGRPTTPAPPPRRTGVPARDAALVEALLPLVRAHYGGWEPL